MAFMEFTKLHIQENRRRITRNPNTMWDYSSTSQTNVLNRQIK